MLCWWLVVVVCLAILLRKMDDVIIISSKRHHHFFVDTFLKLETLDWKLFPVENSFSTQWLIEELSLATPRVEYSCVARSDNKGPTMDNGLSSFMLDVTYQH